MLFFDADGSVERWVAQQLGADSFGPARAIGITLDKKFLGGVVYHRLANENVEMSIATSAPRWATRAHIRDLFAYPFGTLQVRRITTTVTAAHATAIDMHARLGFAREGTLREYMDGKDTEIFGMLVQDCKWIK